MKTRSISLLPVILLATIAVILIPQVVHSFWYGADFTEIAEYLDNDAKEALTDVLLQDVLPSIDQNLFINDNTYGDSGVTIPDTGEAYAGYTLLNVIVGRLCGRTAPGSIAPFNSCGALLIDMEGNLINEWPMMAVPAEIVPGGDVLGFVIDGPPIGGIPTLMQMDYCGEPVWSWSADTLRRPGGARVHHDIQVKSNPVYHAPDLDTDNAGSREGKVLVLSNHDEFLPQFGFFGINVPWSNFPLQDDAIYEVERDGSVSWSWFPADHISELGFSDEALDAIRFVRSQGIGGPPAGDFGPTDWAHLNTAGYVGENKWYDMGDQRFHPDNIITDSRTANWIAIIARHTGGGYTQGDIVWKVGPHFHDGYKENRLNQIIGPHMAHIIPEGLPGEGNVMVFDNGGMAGYDVLATGTEGTYPATIRHYSRILEFDPITLEKVWEYNCPVERVTGKKQGRYLERKFYSRLISGAQRTPAGTTVITEGMSGRIFEVDEDGKLVWEYIVPEEFANGAFGIGPGGFLPVTSTYRSQRIPYSWLNDVPACD